MTKFIITDYGEPIMVADTLSDAEEYLLSVIEEKAYEHFLSYIFYSTQDVESYVNGVNKWPLRKKFKTSNATMLYNAGCYYDILECAYLN